jgi:hypothetical protein
MIVIRNCFLAKPGQASKLAKMLKEAAAVAKMGNVRILTDMTGDFNRVVMEIEAENIGQFETNMKEYSTNQAMRDKMAGYTDLWATGHREIMQVMA